MIWAAVGVVLAIVGASLLVRWGMGWGSTSAERARRMPGDEYLDGMKRTRVVMTRATSVDTPPERVWSWVAQLGRGAGWYSVDLLDNGRKVSAWHLVSWIPEPQLGDATAVGYVRHIMPGRSMAWWLGDGRFMRSAVRAVTCFEVSPKEGGARVISRMSADATGPTAHLALLTFRVIDSVMACRQLVGLRQRVESCEGEGTMPKDPETGDRDQYQLYEVLYANGGCAGVPGKEEGAKWRRSAIRDGVIEYEK